MFLVEQPDFQGKDSLWYLDEFDLYKLLDHKIIDRVMNEFWNGKGIDKNSSILDYSTSYNLYADKHQIMISDNVLSEVAHQASTFSRFREKTHDYKLFVWKESI